MGFWQAWEFIKFSDLVLEVYFSLVSLQLKGIRQQSPSLQALTQQLELPNDLKSMKPLLLAVIIQILPHILQQVLVLTELREGSSLSKLLSQSLEEVSLYNKEPEEVCLQRVTKDECLAKVG